MVEQVNLRDIERKEIKKKFHSLIYKLWLQGFISGFSIGFCILAMSYKSYWWASLFFIIGVGGIPARKFKSLKNE